MNVNFARQRHSCTVIVRRLAYAVDHMVGLYEFWGWVVNLPVDRPRHIPIHLRSLRHRFAVTGIDILFVSTHTYATV